MEDQNFSTMMALFNLYSMILLKHIARKVHSLKIIHLTNCAEYLHPLQWDCEILKRISENELGELSVKILNQLRRWMFKSFLKPSHSELNK